jgi:hypothetical protein
LSIARGFLLLRSRSITTLGNKTGQHVIARPRRHKLSSLSETSPLLPGSHWSSGGHALSWFHLHFAILANVRRQWADRVHLGDREACWGCWGAFAVFARLVFSDEDLIGEPLLHVASGLLICAAVYAPRGPAPTAKT